MSPKKPLVVQEPTPDNLDCDHRYAAIDIGSNGVRLLLSRVLKSGQYCVFTKESLVRMPIRLGADVFVTGSISQRKADQLVSSLQGFEHLIHAYQPLVVRACATSAMREASNGPEIVERIRATTDLELEIIDGGMEAEIIMSTHVEQTLDSTAAYLYIDVGGGSTEVTVYAKGERLASRSFRVGTVRMLEQSRSAEEWSDMEAWMRTYARPHTGISAIGSGGNINKLLRMAGKTGGKPVSYTKLRNIQKEILSYSLEERIRVLAMRPDRADVIVPAADIFLSIMKWSGCQQIFIPQFGLVDGLVRLMHANYLVESHSN